MNRRNTVPAPLAPWPFPFWVAHRGAGKLAPENTLAALRHGASFGYHAFECDVKLSADGQPFLLHDATLERTTPAKGSAGKRAWQELALLDAGGWHSPRYAGEPLPTLAAIATYVQANGFALNIEIKPSPGTERETGQAVGTATLELWPQVLVPGTACPVLFSSFKPEALAGAQASAPGIPRALLLDAFWPGWEQVARELGCCAIVTHHKMMDADLRQRLRDEGWRALCYTVNEPADAQRLIKLDVDGLITDAVDRFAPALRSAHA